ncbi:MAG: ABC transporter ATP-binding protein [Anaerolineales bacterium]|nr:ABC transporter ATP-binding protein [Anaerolineales bacterium]
MSFEVQQGEVLGVIGRNGAGKSTLLKILSRITAPTSGRVKVQGRIASLLEVGTGFHPELTGRENIYLNSAILGMRRDEIRRKFDEIVDFAGVEQFIDTPVKRYSSGMYVRLAFAVAAHLEPEILLVDEVLAVGDAEFQKKCLGKMGDVAREGRTVLFVSHNMVSIQNLCSHSMLLNNGIIKKSGNTEEIITYYLQKFGAVSKLPSLLERTDRRGNRLLIFTKVEIFDTDNKPIDTIISGQNILFRFHYLCKQARSGAEVCVSFVVREQEYPLTNINSIDSGQSNLELFKSGVFECVWPNFNLTANVYDCSLFCSINGEIADWVDQAFKFEVEDGDFFKSGKKIGFQSKFLIPHSWSSKSKSVIGEVIKS